MSPIAAAVNTAWLFSCRAGRARFAAATADVGGTQRAVLAEILAADAETAFGRDHDLRPDDGPAQLAAKVPILTYDDLAPYIERIAAGEPGVLTSDPVRVLQPTSGSTGGRKLIPYTAALQARFQPTISAWIGDLFSARPDIRRGRAYWSISPAFAPEAPTPGGIPVGFADDTEYLGRLERRAVRRVLAVPPTVTDAPTTAGFRHRTLAHLLDTPDLALISVWSPTFLTALIDELFDATDQVLAHLRTLDRRRARSREQLLGRDLDRAEILRELWPQLDVISCWTDGAAAAFVPTVQRLFPTTAIQPKGLLATEAFITFPLVGSDGGALAASSHFFEFLPADGDRTDSTLRAEELERGGRYKPVVTTGGGLYRYLLDDIVEVVGRENTLPRLRFLGRAAGSDLVGEKLDEAFVAARLADTLGTDVDGDAPLLVPDRRQRRYRLVVGPTGTGTGTGERTDIEEAGRRLDVALRTNPHYGHARDLGQLDPIDVVMIPGRPPHQLWEQTMLDRGVRLGDIKPTGLVTSLDVADELLISLEAEGVAVGLSPTLAEDG